jgi:adenylate cyclase
MVLLLAVGVSAGFLARVLPGVPALGATIALGVAVAAGAQVMFSTQARLMPLATPVVVQLPVALFVGLLLRYRDIRRQVPIEVDPDAPQMLFNGVCLTADVKGYTGLAERLSPDELHRLLDEYYEILRETVTARKGLVWGRGGDSALCVWKAHGAVSEKRARLNACLAAIDLRDRIDRFNARHPATERLVTCIGLDTGPIGLGPVGGELQAVGSPANAASRIEGLNRHLRTRILASEAVVEDLAPIAVRRLGRFALHGMAGDVGIVEVLGERDGVTDDARRVSERFAASLGRFEERDWAAAAEGFAQLAKDAPGYGPAEYLRDVSLRYLAAPPPGDRPVIHVASK